MLSPISARLRRQGFVPPKLLPGCKSGQVQELPEPPKLRELPRLFPSTSPKPPSSNGRNINLLQAEADDD